MACLLRNLFASQCCRCYPPEMTRQGRCLNRRRKFRCSLRSFRRRRSIANRQKSPNWNYHASCCLENPNCRCYRRRRRNCPIPMNPMTPKYRCRPFRCDRTRSRGPQQKLEVPIF